jgi:hypothetical protein
VPGRGRRVALLLLAALGVTVAVAFAGDVYGIYRLFFPTEAAWDSKVGWRLCNGAIAAWPQKPAPECRTLHMCANEGALGAAEKIRLKQMMAALPGCEPL